MGDIKRSAKAGQMVRCRFRSLLDNCFEMLALAFHSIGEPQYASAEVFVHKCSALAGEGVVASLESDCAASVKEAGPYMYTSGLLLLLIERASVPTGYLYSF